MSIIVSDPQRGARALERTVIEQESYLQRYIYDHPDTLPLQEFKENVRLLILTREFPTGSGPIDAFAIDQDGDIYLIETKLYKNPDKRIVLAQILDYGASLWSEFAEDPDSLIEKLEELLSQRKLPSVAARIGDFYSKQGEELTELLDRVKQSARTGRFHFVVLMDRLEERLKDLISFINSHSDFQVLGVGLDFYKDEALDILIPTLYGAEIRKTAGAAGGSPRRRWNSADFFRDAESKTDPATMSALHALLDWSNLHADEVSWGTGGKTGSFSVKFFGIDTHSVFTALSSGVLGLNFRWLDSTESSKEWAKRLGERLRREGVFPVPDGFLRTFVTLKPEQWNQQVSSFTQVLAESVPKAKRTSSV